MILLASSTGMPAPQIAGVVRTDESHVRKVTHAFNDRGFASLDPDYRGWRPNKTTPVQRDRIVSVARARPDTGRGVDALVVAQRGDAPGGNGFSARRRRCA
jgi:transposase